MKIKLRQAQEACTDTEVGKFISHFEMNLLSDEDRELFELHLFECKYCRQETTEMNSTTDALHSNRIELLRSLEQDGITFESLREKLRKPKKESLLAKLNNLLSRLNSLYWGSSALAVAAAVLFIVYFSRDQLNPYEDLLSFAPLDSPSTIVLRSDTMIDGEEYFNQGIESYNQKDYKTAIEHLQKATKISPSQGTWWLVMGTCYFLQRETDDAIEVLNHADRITSGRTKRETRWYLANSYLLDKYPQPATELLEWLIHEDKEYSNRAVELLEQLGRIENENK